MSNEVPKSFHPSLPTFSDWAQTPVEDISGKEWHIPTVSKVHHLITSESFSQEKCNVTSFQLWFYSVLTGHFDNPFSSQFASTALIMSTAAAARFDSCYNAARQPNFFPSFLFHNTHAHTLSHTQSLALWIYVGITAMVHHGVDKPLKGESNALKWMYEQSQRIQIHFLQ